VLEQIPGNDDIGRNQRRRTASWIALYGILGEIRSVIEPIKAIGLGGCLATNIAVKTSSFFSHDRSSNACYAGWCHTVTTE
jgi:hypothetical protein